MGLKHLHHQSGLVRRSESEAGIALGTILFLLAIVAIIAAAIAAGSSGFHDNVSNEGGAINASTLIQTGEALQNAVRAVAVGNSCAPTQISFSNPVITGINGYDVYANPNAPSNGSCNVFGTNGGGMSFPMITASTLETADQAHFLFSSGVMIQGLGSSLSASGDQLAAYLPVDSNALCLAINNQVGLSQLNLGEYVNNSNYPNGWFQGQYSSTGSYLFQNSGNTYPSPVPLMGCLQAGYAGTPGAKQSAGYSAPKFAPYFFYVVLLIQ